MMAMMTALFSDFRLREKTETSSIKNDFLGSISIIYHFTGTLVYSIVEMFSETLILPLLQNEHEF